MRGFQGSRTDREWIDPTGPVAGAVVGALALALVLLSFAVPGVAIAGGDANRASCPLASEESAGFRAFLPDCRAYEMVTPPYKQGYAVHFNGLGGGGDQIFGRSLAGLAETEGAPQVRGSIGAEYRFVRGQSGWSPLALTPANPGFRSAVSFEAVAPDGGATLFQMPAAPVGNDHFYLRRADGSLADVGPATPAADGPTKEPAPEGPSPGSARLAGASGDMSHIVFAVSSPWGWPADTTVPGGEDLYEYTGTGNAEPTMVAVDGGRGATDLLADCGETLGGPLFTSAYNAVSSSGDVIVFTPTSAEEWACGGRQPAHAELYARIDGERTLWLSEPQCDPLECPHSTPSAAVFEGAAPGGERGWFLSTQRLTAAAVDDGEPGDSASGTVGSGCQDATGPGCNLYEYDLARPAGERLRVVSLGSTRPHVQGVVRVSPDGSHVYFVATAVLAAEPGPGGSEPVEGQDNLYVSESAGGGESKLRFVATLAEGDEELWGARFGSDEGRPAVASADGATLLFASRADLTPDDTSSGVSQLFLYRDGAEPTLQRVSIGQDGFAADGNTDEFAAAIPAPDYQGAEAFRPQAGALSADGGAVVFESQDALTPGAGPPGGTSKLYEYRDAQVYLLDPDPDGSSRLIGLSGSGRDVFFETARPLVRADGDAEPDIYDARVEGGFAEASPNPICSGEACLGPAAGGEAAARPGSLDLIAPRRAHPGSLRRTLRACRHRSSMRARHRCERRVRRHHRSGAR